MRTSKLNYALVGLFVLAAIVGMVVAVSLLTGRTGATDSYYTIYNNVTGVKFGTQVVYEGYPIGQVTRVTPRPEDGGMTFRVEFDVTDGWRIPEDSRVEIAAPGLLAAVTLAIQAGDSGQALEPGSRVPSRERQDMFAMFSNVAGQFGDLSEAQIRPLLTNVNQTVSTINEMLRAGGKVDESIDEVGLLLRETRETVTLVRERLPKIADDIERFAVAANQVTDELTQLMSPTNRRKIEDIMATMQTASHSFDATLLTMNAILADIDDLLLDEKGDAMRTLEEARYITESVARHIDAINHNMESAARNMNEFTRQIRQNPGLLLDGKAVPDEAVRP